VYKYILSLLAILLLFLVGGCSSVKVETDYDPAFDTGALETFAIVDEGTKRPDSLNEERIREALIRQIRAKGFKRAAPEEADFHIMFYSAVEEDVPSNVSFGVGIGTYSSGVGASVGKSTNVTYDRGKLFINMIDPKTHKTFWRAAATEKLRRFESPRERADYLDKTVASMLKDFPDRSTEKKENR
jgi:hypothetical protein